MYTAIVIGVGLSIGIIRSIIYKKSNSQNNIKVKVFNISDRAVKHKRYQMALNERTKPFSKR